MDPFEPTAFYTLQKTLETPGHISCLAFGHAGHLFAGSNDGSLRVYDLSSFKVIRAIRNLGAEVSSMVCFKRSGSELRDVWLACGSRLMKFQMDSPKIIQTIDDSLSVIEVKQSNESDDALNELAMNVNKSHLAFSMDSGIVGVVDLSTNAITKMKGQHESICGSVKFIPNRPQEIVSGGYDTTLLHFDFSQGNILSSRKIPADANVGGMALAPPFIMSMAISLTGLVAAGTADGRLWLGCGGYRPLPKHGKKRPRKWEGLNEEGEVVMKIAEGPIVAIAFDESGTLVVSTLLGVLSRYQLSHDNAMKLHKTWQSETKSIKKVNALVIDEKRIIVGGLTTKGKGVFEVWKREHL